MFESRYPKRFCSMACYAASPQFDQNRKLAVVRAAKSQAKSLEEYRELNTVPCQECGTPYYKPPGRGALFCSRICYRTYMAKRFDRWMASPQRISLPQSFDEFLTQNELPCLVEGCDWSGRHLSQHMNYAHGVTASEFKRAAGFNMSTGVVSADLSAQLSARPNIGVALTPNKPGHAPQRTNPLVKNYYSLEAREHQAKARLLDAGGPMRNCCGCDRPFQQTSKFGKAKYHSIECRDASYREQRLKRSD